MKNQTGFTLIELVIVIVLLGVLAAIAVPRFVNLEDDAVRAQRNATAAAITSAMNINYAECAVNNHTPNPPDGCRTVDSCDDALLLIANSGTSLSTPPYTALTSTVVAGANGTTASCTLTRAGVSGNATFTLVKAGT